MELNHYLQENIDNNKKIYRYFTFCKLEDLLKNKSLFFCNTEEFKDRKERDLPKQFLRNMPEDSKNLVEKIHNDKIKDIQSYVSCWTISNDSYAFWKIYTPNADGCMITTTIGKVKTVLNNSNIVTYKVEYVDDDSKVNCPIVYFDPNSKPDSRRGTEKFKIKSYEYEKEIRFVYYSKEKIKGYNYPINSLDFINSFTISPFANEKEKKRITDLIKKYVCEPKFDDSIIEEK